MWVKQHWNVKVFNAGKNIEISWPFPPLFILSALQGCQKIGDFHQGTGVLLRLADLSTMWSAGICQIDRSLANWISQQYLLMRLTDFWLLGLCVHQKVGKREKATAVNPESSRGIFALFPPCFAATCFFLRNCHRPGCWLPRAVLQISKQ